METNVKPSRVRVKGFGTPAFCSRSMVYAGDDRAGGGAEQLQHQDGEGDHRAANARGRQFLHGCKDGPVKAAELKVDEEHAQPEERGIRLDDTKGDVERRQHQHDPEHEHGPPDIGSAHENVAAVSADERAEDAGDNGEPGTDFGDLGTVEATLPDEPELFEGRCAQ